MAERIEIGTAHALYLELIVPADSAMRAQEICHDLAELRDGKKPDEDATYVHARLPDGSHGIFIAFNAAESLPPNQEPSP